MRSTLLTVAGILLLTASESRAEIPWNDNLRSAHQQAEQEGKLLLLHFYSDNCHWCDKLEEGAFQSPQLAGAIAEHYVPVKIHAGQNPTLAKTFRVSRFPTDVIVATDGSVLSHGVSPQAPQDYIGMLARYSDRAAGAADPLTPQFSAETQVAATTPDPQVTSPESPTAPQINRFAMGPVASSQANPYAQQTPPAIATPAVTPPPATANLQAPRAESFAATPPIAQPTATATEFSMPPNPSRGAPTKTVAHRTNEMSLAPASDDAACTDPACTDSACMVADAEPAASEADPALDSGDAAGATDGPQLALQGYCPVAVLDQHQWVAGDPQYGLIHLGQLYLFSNAAAMESFRSDPEIYTPVMNGMDVVLFFEERRLVQGSREWGVKDPEFNRMFFFANEDTMNHFNQEHARYTRSAIEVTRQAAAEANQVLR